MSATKTEESKPRKEDTKYKRQDNSKQESISKMWDNVKEPNIYKGEKNEGGQKQYLKKY